MISKNLINTTINNIKIVGYFSDKVKKKQYFECICFCGKRFTSRADAIKSGATKSCGCITGDLISSKNRLDDNAGATNLILRYYRKGAKNRGLDFNLTKNEFLSFLNKNCYYCNSEPRLAKFTTSQKNRRNREIIYNGIDRLNNDIGYTLENCVTCCNICNAAKMDRTFDEFIAWINRLVGFVNAKK